MTCEEISKFFGCGRWGAIKSRLSRARRRFKEGGTYDTRGFREFPNYTEPYRERYARDFTPETGLPPSGSKPVVPWDDRLFLR